MDDRASPPPELTRFLQAPFGQVRPATTSSDDDAFLRGFGRRMNEWQVGRAAERLDEVAAMGRDIARMGQQLASLSPGLKLLRTKIEVEARRFGTSPSHVAGEFWHSPNWREWLQGVNGRDDLLTHLVTQRKLLGNAVLGLDALVREMIERADLEQIEPDAVARSARAAFEYAEKECAWLPAPSPGQVAIGRIIDDVRRRRLGDVPEAPKAILRQVPATEPRPATRGPALP